MPRTIITTPAAPSAPSYSQAVVAAGLVFVSGTAPIDPATGQLVKGSVQAQVAQCLRNISAILEAAGSSLENVVKTTCFLTDLNDFAVFNSVYTASFGDTAPARSTVQVAGLPRAVLVEVEAVALAGG